MRAPYPATTLLCALAAALAAPAGAYEWVPVASVDLLGGQYFFQGQHTSFSGNGDWLFSPGLQLSERDALIPLLSGQYRRTREVRELVGGGFLTQESLDNTAALKYVRLLSESWNVKPSLSYKNELITESEDETLGNGLFDYHKVSAGVELERTGGELVKSLRQSVNVYAIRFYHYRALSAQSADLGAEVNAGDRVLDFDAYDYSVAADLLPREGTLLSASFLASVRPYRDQKLVTLAGTYSSADRLDLYFAGALSGRQALPAWGRLESAAGLNAALYRSASNQHNYDAQNTRFNPGYYDYVEFAAGPFVAARWDKGPTASLSYDYTQRNYDRRPIQDAAGLYGQDAIRMRTHTVAASLTWPLLKGLSAKLQGSYRRATSNMLYESTYRYNYWTAHYFAGLGWTL